MASVYNYYNLELRKASWTLGPLGEGGWLGKLQCLLISYLAGNLGWQKNQKVSMALSILQSGQ